MSPINFLKRREKPLAVVSDSFLNFYIQSFRKGEQVSQVRNNVWNANNFTLIMASLQRLYRPHCYNAQTLAALLKVRAKRADTQLSPSRKAEQTLTKFTKAYSQARLSRKTTYRQPKQSQKKKTKKVYSQLFNEIKEIKQTLKESIANTSASRKRKLSKRSQKVLTQISDTDQMLRPSHSRGKNAYNYNDVLKHIEDYKKDYKNRYKVTKLQKAADLQANPESQKMQKTLFYGIDYIDSIQFKIKIKLSKAGYLLFAKNNNTKMMVEMSYAEYMRLNLSQLKGNPCRILAYLKIENNTVKLRLKNGLKLYTFKSFLSYY